MKGKYIMLQIRPTVNSLNRVNYPIFLQKRYDSNNKYLISSQDNSTSKKIVTTAGIIGFLSLIGIIGVKTKSTYINALKKQGLELKDGIAYLANSNEQFTGTVKRNSKFFGIEKEAVIFDKGVIKEKLSYGLFGKEKEGYFYENGELKLQVLNVISDKKNKNVRFLIFKENQLHARGDAEIKNDSVFDWARNYLKSIE